MSAPAPVRLMYKGRILTPDFKIKYIYVTMAGDDPTDSAQVSPHRLGKASYPVGTILTAIAEKTDTGWSIRDLKPTGMHRNKEQLDQWTLHDHAAYTAYVEWQAVKKLSRPSKDRLYSLANDYRKCPDHLRASLLAYVIRQIVG